MLALTFELAEGLVALLDLRPLQPSPGGQAGAEPVGSWEPTAALQECYRSHQARQGGESLPLPVCCAERLPGPWKAPTCQMSDNIDSRLRTGYPLSGPMADQAADLPGRGRCPDWVAGDSISRWVTANLAGDEVVARVTQPMPAAQTSRPPNGRSGSAGRAPARHGRSSAAPARPGRILGGQL